MLTLLFLYSKLSTEQTFLLGFSGIFVPYAMFNLDVQAREFSQTYLTRYDPLFSITNELGRGELHVVGWGTLYAISKLTNSPKLEEVSLEGIRSFLASGITVLALKSLFGRARPYMNQGALSFHPLTLDDDYMSFPSGHAIVAFSSASVISANYKHPVVRFVSYTLATAVALSRMEKDRHWLSDVFMGAVLGGIIGWKIGEN